MAHFKRVDDFLVELEFEIPWNSIPLEMREAKTIPLNIRSSAAKHFFNAEVEKLKLVSLTDSPSFNFKDAPERGRDLKFTAIFEAYPETPAERYSSLLSSPEFKAIARDRKPVWLFDRIGFSLPKRRIQEILSSWNSRLKAAADWEGYETEPEKSAEESLKEATDLVKESVILFLVGRENGLFCTEEEEQLRIERIGRLSQACLDALFPGENKKVTTQNIYDFYCNLKDSFFFESIFYRVTRKKVLRFLEGI